MQISELKGITYIKIDCIECGKETILIVKTIDWNRYYKDRELIQDCFPYLTSEDRELILSNICGTCFNTLFKEEE